MNIILLTKNDFVTHDQVELFDRRFVHIKNVLRSKKDDRLKVGMVDGKKGWGQVLDVGHKSVMIKVNLNENAQPLLQTTVILALPRPLMFKRILFKAAMLGVKQVIFINAKRVEKTFWKSHCLERSYIESQLLLGLEQSGETLRPQIVFEKGFKPFVEDRLPDIVRGQHFYLASLSAQRTERQDLNSPSVLAIGPEGGFIPFEEEKLFEAGAKPVSLGHRILRVEDAFLILASRI